MNEKLRVGITHGDINGVGYEVILKAFENPTMLDLCTPIVYGSPKVATYHRKAIDSPTNFTIITNAAEAHRAKLNILACVDDELKVELGSPSQEAGKAALDALERALADYREGLIDVLVTAPINKHTIQSDDFRFPGHTEYIQQRAGDGEKALMILMKDELRVALVTGHLPISAVASTLTKELIQEKLTIFNHALCRDFLIAVLALNPHAGDDGLIGTEEQDIIRPALTELKKQGMFCYGPYPADGFFGSEQYTKFDGILAMYHDQGLAPFKVLAMEEGVNYTAGLPIVRTSPAHGTAYDIAGKGVASAASLCHAIYTALDVHRNRIFYDEARENPLKKQYHEKRDDSHKLKLD